MGDNQIEVAKGVGLGSVVEQETTGYRINYARAEAGESDAFILINVRIDLLKVYGRMMLNLKTKLDVAGRYLGVGHQVCHQVLSCWTGTEVQFLTEEMTHLCLSM